jgi:transcriptional regulator with XRE-family HTH domain
LGQQPNKLNPDQSPLHRWGYELRELRTLRRLSLRRLAEMVNIDHSHLARFERGERAPDRSQVERLDAALDARGELVALWCRTVAPPSQDAAIDHKALVEAGLREWQERVREMAGAWLGGAEITVRLHGHSAEEKTLVQELAQRMKSMAREPRYSTILMAFEQKET